MNRACKTSFLLSIGLWFSLLAMQTTAAQSSAVGSIAPVRISELGLEHRVLSAIDLVGPDDGLAGELRAELVQRLQCWIDGVEGCVAADINDPRVRAFRRHLAFGEYPEDGAVTVLFDDGSRIELGIERRIDLDALALTERAYTASVLLDTARAPGVPNVPSDLNELERLAADLDPEVESALERLKDRLTGSIDSTHAAAPSSGPTTRRTALAQ